MALQGTLDTFALTDVLRLLASTRKTGRLRVSGGRGSGSVWVDAGRVVATEATGLVHADRAVDVVFELLRYADGSFTFEADKLPAYPGEPTDVEPLLHEAEQMLAEWRDIESVVPSLDHWVALVAELPRPDVVVDADRWRTIVAVGGGSSVRRVGEALALDEVPVSREVKQLIELGLASIGPAAAPEPATAPDAYAAAPVAYDAEPAVAPTDDGRVADVLRHPFDPMPEPEPAVADDVAEPQPLRPVFGGLGGHAAEPAPQPLRPVFGAPAEPEPLRPAFGGPAAVPAADPEPLRAAFGTADHEPAGNGFGGAPAAESDPYRPFGAQDPEPARPVFGGPSGLPAADADADRSPFPPAGPTRRTLGRPLPSEPVTVDDPDEVARQLASLSPKAARAVAAAARAETDEEREAALAEVSAETEEPINRGLLLKFLSSVRS